MKTLIINIICLCWGLSICGQKPQATAFEKMVAKADNMLKQGKTAEAIKHYNVARILAGADKKSNMLLNKKIEIVFNTIERQKHEAIKRELFVQNLTNNYKQQIYDRILIDSIINTKKIQIDSFFKNEYIPKFAETFAELIPQNTNYNAELSNILEAVVPRIIGRRELMISKLENVREKVLDKLDKKFLGYEKLILLQKSSNSTIKSENEQKNKINQAIYRNKRSFDLDKLIKTFDKFIKSSGDFEEDIRRLNRSVDEILNN